MKCGRDYYASNCPIRWPIYFNCGKLGYMITVCIQQKLHFNPFVLKTKHMTIGRLYTMIRVEITQNHDPIQNLRQKSQTIIKEQIPVVEVIWNEANRDIVTSHF